MTSFTTKLCLTSMLYLSVTCFNALRQESFSDGTSLSLESSNVIESCEVGWLLPSDVASRLFQRARIARLSSMPAAPPPTTTTLTGQLFTPVALCIEYRRFKQYVEIQEARYETQRTYKHTLTLTSPSAFPLHDQCDEPSLILV